VVGFPDINVRRKRTATTGMRKNTYQLVSLPEHFQTGRSKEHTASSDDERSESYACSFVTVTHELAISHRTSGRIGKDY
jgi:hypothetical protein